jgi:zinc-ribbon domain
MGGYRRFCVECGSELKPGARFCANCGHAAANDPPPAATSEHEVATRDLPVPPPSSGWGASAAPPEGGLFAPPGSALPPQGAPFLPEEPRFPTAGPTARSQDVPYPPARLPGPPGSFGFAGGDTSPGSRGAGFPPPGAAATSTGLALPPARPAPTVTARLPAGPPPAGHAPGGAAIPAAATDTAQFPKTWADDVGFSPQWEPAPADAASQPAGTRERSRRLLAVGLFALVAAVIVVPALLIAQSFHSITGGGAAAAKPTAKQPGRGSTAAAPTQRAAAAGLATLLAQTAADRSSIVNAVGAVEHCTAALAQAPQVFQNSAASRQRLLQQLAALPGRSALPAPMLQELTGAWQASAAVDTDLGKWAQDEAIQGCKPNDHADANYQASGPADVQATSDKTVFVSMWNTIAAKYGLTRYQTSQL